MLQLSSYGLKPTYRLKLTLGNDKTRRIMQNEQKETQDDPNV